MEGVARGEGSLPSLGWRAATGDGEVRTMPSTQQFIKPVVSRISHPAGNQSLALADAVPARRRIRGTKGRNTQGVASLLLLAGTDILHITVGSKQLAFLDMGVDDSAQGPMVEVEGRSGSVSAYETLTSITIQNIALPPGPSPSLPNETDGVHHSA
ncbi:hypothetical protein LZ32DRAFT_10704 [Colletotrichum eremochloae]|nr:hypothetical protein LZ32DRAFT_10704 [Colletotrichum eremochloae]